MRVFKTTIVIVGVAEAAMSIYCFMTGRPFLGVTNAALVVINCVTYFRLQGLENRR